MYINTLKLKILRIQKIGRPYENLNLEKQKTSMDRVRGLYQITYLVEKRLLNFTTEILCDLGVFINSDKDRVFINSDKVIRQGD